MSDPSVWFITGASSGFGHSVVEYVLGKGDIAVATLRKPEALEDLKTKYPSTQLLILKLDVTKPEEITEAFTKAKETFGKIDVVFNNAGYGILAEFEGTSEDVARAMFEVNFWGANRISREAVKFFRDVNKPGTGGRLLNVSSMVGLNAAPGLAYYSASKHALEGITQSLAGELDPEWNIKVTLIEPGGFVTKGQTDNLVRLPVHPKYAKPDLPVNFIRGAVANAPHTSADPDKAARKFYELAQLVDPPLRFLIGKDAIAYSKEQLKKVGLDSDKYESWSEGLGFDKRD